MPKVRPSKRLRSATANRGEYAGRVGHFALFRQHPKPEPFSFLVLAFFLPGFR